MRKRGGINAQKGGYQCDDNFFNAVFINVFDMRFCLNILNILRVRIRLPCVRRCAILENLKTKATPKENSIENKILNFFTWRKKENTDGLQY